MKGATRSRRGNSALRKRCPRCKILRKFCEPPGDQGGEDHPRRPKWQWLPEGWVCGWCVIRANGQTAKEWFQKVKQP